MPVYAGLHAGRNPAGAETKGRAQLHGDVHQRPAVRAAHVREHGECADEEAGVAVHARAPTARPAAASGSASKSLSVKFAGLDITEMSRMPLTAAGRAPPSVRRGHCRQLAKPGTDHPEKAVVTQRIAEDLDARLAVLLDLGLGYLSLERSTPTLSPGELQRLRLATQVRSNLFGVVYVLDEPSAGLHPADTEALLRGARPAQGGGELAVRGRARAGRDPPRRLDRGCRAGGGRARRRVLYSGPPDGLAQVEELADPALSVRRGSAAASRTPRAPRAGCGWTGVTRNNLHGLDAPSRSGCSPP